MVNERPEERTGSPGIYRRGVQRAVRVDPKILEQRSELDIRRPECEAPGKGARVDKREPRPGAAQPIRLPREEAQVEGEVVAHDDSRLERGEQAVQAGSQRRVVTRSIGRCRPLLNDRGVIQNRPFNDPRATIRAQAGRLDVEETERGDLKWELRRWRGMRRWGARHEASRQ